MEIMSLTQAAARLGLSRETLKVQARRGKLRATKIGNIWTVTAAEVQRYEVEHKGRFGFADKRVRDKALQTRKERASQRS